MTADEESTLTALRVASQALDTGAVAGVLAAAMRDRGVDDTWLRVCVPALRGATTIHDGADIAVEHALSEGLRLAFDAVSAPRYADIRVNDVVLACTPGEGHTLPLQALAASLFERRIGACVLGARVPWPALHRTICRTSARTAVIWAQTTHGATAADLGAIATMAARHRATRFMVAGPGWTMDRPPHALPDDVVHLTDFRDAVDACAAVNR